VLGSAERRKAVFIDRNSLFSPCMRCDIRSIYVMNLPPSFSNLSTLQSSHLQFKSLHYIWLRLKIRSRTIINMKISRSVVLLVLAISSAAVENVAVVRSTSGIEGVYLYNLLFSTDKTVRLLVYSVQLC